MCKAFHSLEGKLTFLFGARLLWYDLKSMLDLPDLFSDAEIRNKSRRTIYVTLLSKFG